MWPPTPHFFELRILSDHIFLEKLFLLKLNFTFKFHKFELHQRDVLKRINNRQNDSDNFIVR